MLTSPPSPLALVPPRTGEYYRLMHTTRASSDPATLPMQEWVFPTGWFLMAYLIFDRKAGAGQQNPEYTLHHISNILLKHRDHVRKDSWRGLPELTNSSALRALSRALGSDADVPLIDHPQTARTATTRAALRRGARVRSWTCWRRCTRLQRRDEGIAGHASAYRWARR